jgi:phosphoglycolate phosphatase
MPQLQGLIFDLEGTLLDGVVDLRQAINLILAEHARRSLTLDEVRVICGEGALLLIQRAFAATGDVPAGDIMPYVHQFLKHYRNVKADPWQIYPHVVPFLGHIFEKGVKLGICTNKQEAASHRVLDQLGLGKYFEFVAGGDTFPVHKPNPEHVYGVITALDVPRENCVFIGDGRNDIKAAHGAKIPCIIVTHGYGIDAADVQNADGVVADFDELGGALEGLGFRITSII